MTDHTVPQDEICKDASALRDKRKVMAKSWYNSMFFSVADTLKVVAGILTPVGIGVVLPTLLKPENAALGIMESLALVPTANLVVAGVAVAITVAAIGMSYVSSRYYHSSSVDALEMSAQHTAHYIAEELEQAKARRAAQEYDNPAPTHGKTWQEISQPTAARTRLAIA